MRPSLHRSNAREGRKANVDRGPLLNTIHNGEKWAERTHIMLNALAPWTYLPILSQHVDAILLKRLKETFHNLLHSARAATNVEIWTRLVHFLWVNHPEYRCGYTGIVQSIHQDHSRGNKDLLQCALNQLKAAEFAAKKSDGTPRFGKGEKDGKE